MLPLPPAPPQVLPLRQVIPLNCVLFYAEQTTADSLLVGVCGGKGIVDNCVHSSYLSVHCQLCFGAEALHWQMCGTQPVAEALPSHRS